MNLNHQPWSVLGGSLQDSAHVDYAESELVAKSFHTSLNAPATIEEVRRILRLHLNGLLTVVANGPSHAERPSRKNAN